MAINQLHPHGVKTQYLLQTVGKTQTHELYVSGGFTTEEINLFHGKSAPKGVQVLTDSVGNKSIDSMTKLELEALARTKGVELDRRKSKSKLLEKVKDLLVKIDIHTSIS